MSRLHSHYADRVAVVTGAASGIGLALAKSLHGLGAKVVMADFDPDALAKVLAGLGSDTSRSLALEVDVSNAAAVQAMVAEVRRYFGRIDFLFNNAGIGGTLPIGQATLAHWRKIVDVNLWGVIHGVDAVLPLMREQGNGHIINTSSISGIVPFPGQVLYNTTKFGVVGLSLSLRNELAAEGIRVSCINPGLVATAIFGVPILGERINAAPPPGAIAVEDAAWQILDGVRRNRALIVFPAAVRWIYRLFRFFPGFTERHLLQKHF
ncbi:SDR family NAD(P)-dependent oxidoreductase [Uliginosibacterium gangwonense]|uniref:SDR family NAD(P)-dependent oxidoreductase n=1 Tax=Uliginosibacterium gangwonense TaxID=392736 RepID=UPI00035CE77A|nr:SDR family oxidoreductase [Uliginosibacterium gangwonense]